MNGVITVTVDNSGTEFIITLDRNITLIRGDSGTGKSYVCSLISDNLRKAGSTVSVSNGASVFVMPDLTMNDLRGNWVDLVKNLHNTIVFIDEECDCMDGQPFNFFTGIKGTDNYYVIVHRGKLSELPYSVDAIYELVKDEQLSLEKTVIVNKHLYTNSKGAMNVSNVITEDSKSGFKFFSSVVSNVKSANGKSNMNRFLLKALKRHESNIFMFADGAAFGPDIGDVVATIDAVATTIALYVPESFEWFALHSKVFSNNEYVQHILANYLSEIDYTKYSSVEQLMTEVFTAECKKLGYDYDKSDVPPFIMEPSNVKHLLSLIPGVSLRPIGSYSLADLLHDPATLMALMTKHPKDYEEWFTQTFPNGASSAEEVLSLS